MSRLPLLTYDDTDERQRALWDQIAKSRGDALDIVTSDGELAGPFAAFVLRPALGEHLISVGAQVRFNSSLPDHLLELAITTVGARWKSEFEFWAHSGLAVQAGIRQEVIDALAHGHTPVFDDEAERAIYNYALDLSTDGHVDQAVYDAAEAVVGTDGIVDLTHTIGYYSQISFILNAFDVPLPPDVSPTWDQRR